MNSNPKDQVLELFHPAIRGWFRKTFEAPTPPQILGWPVIDRDQSVLILAPTGSGKTLTAFLVCLNKLLQKLLNDEEPGGVFILYISPLKALNYDIERNLKAPLQGIHLEADQLGLQLPGIRQAVRTGDTPQNERQRMLRKPPHLLITTPESLHLILTSKSARHILATVRYVIVDEIHALSDNKRGTFLSLLLERLQVLVRHPFVRIGLSATQRPLDLIAQFLGGFEKKDEHYHARPVTIIDAGMRKNLELQIVSPVADMTALPEFTIWPSIYQKLIELIGKHRTTLIFANNRAVVEKITAKLNEQVGEQLVRAHHGSVSKTVRQNIEQQLKAGELSALAATATLELGIDMGAIDLVCQVESPHSVATGLQRVGRAGHLFTTASKGRLIPKMRSDLLEMAAITRAMAQGEVAEIKVPQNCLDVLAQQIVAMVAMENWEVNALYDVIRSAAPYQNLPRTYFLSVLEMLAGRYPAESFRHLKPRISWDRINNMLYSLPGSQRLVILNGGTIPETGQYPVYVAEGMVKVGELEEEFVYEARIGDNFQLGTNTWRILNIEANRVLVTAVSAPSAKVPFWKGDISGRASELGKQVGDLSRQIKARLNDSDCLEWLQKECFLDHHAAWNLRNYFLAQKRATNAIPDDQTIVIESFFDELGDPRVVLLSPFGRRIHYALRLVIVAQVQKYLQIELESIDGDSGILFRFAGRDPQLIVQTIQRIQTEHLTELITERIAESPLFGARFRQNAGRALLLPRRLPGKRTPLWLLRMRSRDLLEVVRQFDDFPIVVETYRELLQDFFALEELKLLLEQIRSGEISLLVCKSDWPSPFCAQLLFDFTAGYMYDYDTPKKTKSTTGSIINFEQLSELIDPHKLTGLLSQDAIEAVEARLQGTASHFQARDATELVELLRRLGDLTTEEVSARFQGDSLKALTHLAEQHRVCQIYLSGASHPWRWITTEELPLYRAAFANTDSTNPFENFSQVNINPDDLQSGVSVKTLLPTEIEQQPIQSDFARLKIISQFLQNHSLVSWDTLRTRYPLSEDALTTLLNQLTEQNKLIQIPPDSPAASKHWVHTENLEQVRRVTIKRQRQAVQPGDASEFVEFLLKWQHLSEDSRLSGEDGLLTVIEQLQGRIVPYFVWENEIFARRLQTYRSQWLDDLIASGEVTWFGRNSNNSEKNDLVFALSDEVPFIQMQFDQTDPSTLTPEAIQIIEVLKQRGACFLQEIAAQVELRPEKCATILWDLIGSGTVTNDSFRVLRQGKPRDPLAQITSAAPLTAVSGARHPHLTRRLHSTRRRAAGGRWVLMPPDSPDNFQTMEHYERLARQLLLRYGMLCREIFEFDLPDNKTVNWRSLYNTLLRLEWQGEIRRGYFVKGFSGIQFALPVVAAEILAFNSRPLPNKNQPEMRLLNSCDPANLYGAGLPLPLKHSLQSEWQFRRHSNNHLILKHGLPILAIEANGGRLTPLQPLERAELVAALSLLAQLLDDPAGINRIKRIKVEFWDGQPVRLSPIRSLLKEVGFRDEFKMMVLERQY